MITLDRPEGIIIPQIKAILATVKTDKGFIIGIRNKVTGESKLAWNHNKNDMKFFKNMTLNSIVIMGNNTLKSMGNKPLSSRTNIILTSDIANKNHDSFDDNVTFTDFNYSLDVVKNKLDEHYNLYQFDTEVFVIGGSKTYDMLSKYIDEYIVTYINLFDLLPLTESEEYVYLSEKTAHVLETYGGLKIQNVEPLDIKHHIINDKKDLVNVHEIAMYMTAYCKYVGLNNPVLDNYIRGYDEYYYRHIDEILVDKNILIFLKSLRIDDDRCIETYSKYLKSDDEIREFNAIYNAFNDHCLLDNLIVLYTNLVNVNTINADTFMNYIELYNWIYHIVKYNTYYHNTHDVYVFSQYQLSYIIVFKDNLRQIFRSLFAYDLDISLTDNDDYLDDKPIVILGRLIGYIKACYNAEYTSKKEWELYQELTSNVTKITGIIDDRIREIDLHIASKSKVEMDYIHIKNTYSCSIRPNNPLNNKVIGDEFSRFINDRYDSVYEFITLYKMYKLDVDDKDLTKFLIELYQ